MEKNFALQRLQPLYYVMINRYEKIEFEISVAAVRCTILFLGYA